MSRKKKDCCECPRTTTIVVEIILVDGSLFPHTGRITFADSSFNAQTGTFLIRASVDNPKGTLMPNQYVRVRLKGAIRPNAILVPQRAIQQSSKGHFVWVVQGRQGGGPARRGRKLERRRMVRLRGAESGRAGGRGRGPPAEPRHARDDQAAVTNAPGNRSGGRTEEASRRGGRKEKQP